MVGIELFDEDVINTLIPIFSLKPDSVYLFYDKKHSRLISSVARTVRLKVHGITQLKTICVDGDLFADVEKKMRPILAEIKDEVYIELTGGTDIMTACGYKLGMEFNTCLLHVDFDAMNVLNVRTGEIVCPAVDVSLNDYITAIGAKRLFDSHQVPRPAMFPAILNMAEYLLKHRLIWLRVHTVLKTLVAKKQTFLPADRFSKIVGAIPLLDEFVRNGFLIKKNNGYVYHDEVSRSYVIIYGVWLELYVYIKLFQAFGRTDIGVSIDWDGLDADDAHENEIDVIWMYKSIPVLISCKMRKVHPLDICEVGFLAKRLGGLRAQAMVVATDTPSLALQDKTEDYNIAFVSVREMMTMPTEELFKRKLARLGVEI